MKLYSFFQGTDALLISKWKFPCRPYKRLYQVWLRVRTWLLDFLVFEYWVPHKDMIDELRVFGIKKKIRVRKDEVGYPVPFKKVQHDSFNVLYYWAGDRGNAKLWRWIYGYDIYLRIKKFFGNKINWIIVDGTKDMSEIYPIVDFYLRPNRHDGWSRMIDECEINGIPYYWSRTEPNLDEACRKILIALENNIA